MAGKSVTRADHLVFEGTEPIPPNTYVAIDFDREGFLNLLISRLGQTGNLNW
jgi:hypothetical protein